jgi:hypothetical protein
MGRIRYLRIVEKVAVKRALRDEELAPLIEDKELAMRTFFEILERGQALYPEDGTTQGFPRVYRIIPLSQS